MKPIERISLYLQFKSISPHSFEKRIGLSNGYFSKQLRNLGSVGSDILIKIDEYYAELNILWVLNGQGQMISPHDIYLNSGQALHVEEYIHKYEAENVRMKNLEADLEKLQVVIKDKDKIISLYEVISNSKSRFNQENIDNQQAFFGM